MILYNILQSSKRNPDDVNMSPVGLANTRIFLVMPRNLPEIFGNLINMSIFL